MNFENAFLGSRSIQVCHLRSKTPLTSVDRLRGPPCLIQRGRWPLCVPRRRCRSRPPPPWPCTDPAVAAKAAAHSSSLPWPCAQQLTATARHDATAVDEGEGKGGGSCRPTRTPRLGWSSPIALTMREVRARGAWRREQGMAPSGVGPCSSATTCALPAWPPLLGRGRCRPARASSAMARDTRSSSPRRRTEERERRSSSPPPSSRAPPAAPALPPPRRAAPHRVAPPPPRRLPPSWPPTAPRRPLIVPPARCLLAGRPPRRVRIRPTSRSMKGR